MSTGITVPGTAGGNIVVSTGTGDYLQLAAKMASLLNAASVGGTLGVTTVTAGSVVPAPVGGKSTQELGVIGAGGVSTAITGGGNSYTYVVNVTSSPDTIVSSNNQVLSSDVGATIIESGTNTVVATGYNTGSPGSNFIRDIGNYLISTAQANDTIIASGSGTVAAGTGANFVSVSGGSNYVISAGTGDTIRQGSGQTSVLAVGTNSSISGSSNASDILNVSLGGTSNVVFANQTQATITIDAFQPPPGAIIPSITTTGTYNTVAGGNTAAGTLTVVDYADFALISGNADSVVSATVSGNSTNVFGGSGTLNVSASGGSDTVAAGSALSNVTLSGGSAFLFGSAGSTGTLTALDQSNNSVIAPRNQAVSTITLSGSNSVVDGGTNAAATLNLTVTGSADTVYAGVGAETIQTNSNTLVFAPIGGVPLSFIGSGTSAVPTVIGGAGGNEHITVGSGGSGIDFSSGVNDNATITSGNGQATIFGQSGGNVSFIGSLKGGAQFHAYGGSETLSGAGSTTNNLFYGSSVAGSSTQLIGGSGHDIMFAGATAATMTGGGNNDTFVFLSQATGLQGGAHVTITDFNSTDSVFISGYDSTQSAASLFAHATGPAITGGTGLTLTLSDKSTVTFSNLTSVTQLYGHVGYFTNVT